MSMQQLKVVTIVGTRPEIVKLSRVIGELDRHTQHVLVHTGQNFDDELSQVFFRDLEIRPPDESLDAAGSTAAETIGNVIARTDAILELQAPDAVLILGDTNSALSAIPAKRRRIPIFHMEAGNRCFDQRVPEEINRKIVDHISDINLPYTEQARRNLLAEGLDPATVIKTGSPMREVLNHVMPKVRQSDILDRLELEAGRFFLVSTHREENVDDPAHLRSVLDSIQAIAETYPDCKVVFSVHPRTRKRIDALNGAGNLGERIIFTKALGIVDFVRLEIDARCVVSDSGTITEESSLLDFPAVTIRQAHERPEGMDVGTLVMSGLGRDGVLRSVALVLAQHRSDQRSFSIAPDYEADDVSRKVVRLIHSYTEYVNRTVWFRHG